MEGGVSDAQYADSKPRDQSVGLARDLIHALFETVDSHIIVSEPDGKITLCNRSARATFGWPESAGPTKVSDLDPTIGSPLLRALNGEIVADIEVDGLNKSLSGNALPLVGTDGAKLGAMVVLQEVSGQRQAEVVEGHIANVLEIIGDAFMAFDRDWRYIYINAKAVELTGRSREDILGKNVWHEFPEAVKGAFYQELHRAIDEGRPVHFENYYPPLNKWFENDAYPWPQGVSVFYRDITERKRIESDLERKAQKLASSNADLQQFTYAVSHDLQEPLRTVNAYTQLLAKRLTGKLDEDSEELLTEITKSATRMRDMIRDLLLFSRVTQDGDNWFGPTNLEDVLGWAVENLQIAIGESNATITHDPLPVVSAIELQLRQLFQNLIGNAIKYRGAEPVRIHISAREDWGK